MNMATDESKPKRAKRAPKETAKEISKEVSSDSMEGMEVLHSTNADHTEGGRKISPLAAFGAGVTPSAEPTAHVKKDKFLPISILVAAVIIGGAVVFATFYHGGIPSTATGGAVATSTAPGTAGTTVSASTTAALMQLGPRDAILGQENAPVTIVEYGDYQCPFCGEFFSQTEPSIVSDYINTGKVRMVFRNFAFLGPESTAAAEAAECAEDQNALWAYHDALYSGKVADDEKGGSEDDGYFTRALFIQLAGQVGMNVATFTACIDSDKYATTVANEKTTASAAGVDSTPTFYVNGTQILGAEPYSVFQQAINTALGQS
jgi:protein-disulfide isomerase